MNTTGNCITVPQEVVDAIKGHYAAISELFMPYAIHLSAEERSSLPKMSDRSIPFVSKTVDYSETNPYLIPPYLDKQKIKTNFKSSTDTKDIMQVSNQVHQMFEDTMIASGSEAFQAALAVYAAAKQAARAKVPGSDAIVEDLSKRFVHSSNSKKSEKIV